MVLPLNLVLLMFSAPLPGCLFDLVTASLLPQL